MWATWVSPNTAALTGGHYSDGTMAEAGKRKPGAGKYAWSVQGEGRGGERSMQQACWESEGSEHKECANSGKPEGSMWECAGCKFRQVHVESAPLSMPWGHQCVESML